MTFGRGNRSTRRKCASFPVCPPQIPHDMTSGYLLPEMKTRRGEMYVRNGDRCSRNFPENRLQSYGSVDTRIKSRCDIECPQGLQGMALGRNEAVCYFIYTLLNDAIK
jgi:hypothetical protein